MRLLSVSGPCGRRNGRGRADGRRTEGHSMGPLRASVQAIFTECTLNLYGVADAKENLRYFRSPGGVSIL